MLQDTALRENRMVELNSVKMLCIHNISQRKFFVLAFGSASSPPEIVLQTLCKSGLFLAVMYHQEVLCEKSEEFGAWMAKQVEFHHAEDNSLNISQHHSMSCVNTDLSLIHI